MPKRTKEAESSTHNIQSSVAGRRQNELEIAIGKQVRDFRKKDNLTIVEVASRSRISHGMLSKIERGVISPSLQTIYALAGALNVPVTALFRRYEEEREATYVKATENLPPSRQQARVGWKRQELGHSVHSDISFEPYLITILDKATVIAPFQHNGGKLIYMLEGEIIYRHANKTYQLCAGDSLFLDATKPHGPQKFIRVPARFLSITAEAK
jgi:transcriptional regulator with XRE-family HTH domain